RERHKAQAHRPEGQRAARRKQQKGRPKCPPECVLLLDPVPLDQEAQRRPKGALLFGHGWQATWLAWRVGRIAHPATIARKPGPTPFFSALKRLPYGT